jgi:hypothetical protein
MGFCNLFWFLINDFFRNRCSISEDTYDKKLLCIYLKRFRFWMFFFSRINFPETSKTITLSISSTNGFDFLVFTWYYHTVLIVSNHRFLKSLCSCTLKENDHWKSFQCKKVYARVFLPIVYLLKIFLIDKKTIRLINILNSTIDVL